MLELCLTLLELFKYNKQKKRKQQYSEVETRKWMAKNVWVGNFSHINRASLIESNLIKVRSTAGALLIFARVPSSIYLLH